MSQRFMAIFFLEICATRNTKKMCKNVQNLSKYMVNVCRNVQILAYFTTGKFGNAIMCGTICDMDFCKLCDICCKCMIAINQNP